MGLESGSVGSLTHVIIDEVHERDKQADFLLIVLKEALLRQPNLRLILMSATVDVKSYMQV
jgi:HrpA-like RNA helicase